MTEVIDIEEMYNSSDYKMSEEELKQMEEISKQYDEMILSENKKNPPQIGFCGFACDFGCSTCAKSGYDDSDEV